MPPSSLPSLPPPRGACRPNPPFLVSAQRGTRPSRGDVRPTTSAASRTGRGMDDHRTWVSWIAEHRRHAPSASRRLLDACARGVRTVSRRYPGVYFELGYRTDEAVESLVHRVFTDLDGRVFGRHPFQERTPYDTFVDRSMADDRCRYHSFDARLSVTREALRQQYRHNVRRHPAWLRREELHREVVEVLERDCVPFPGRHPRWPRYGLPSWTDALRPQNPGFDPEGVVGLLRRRSGWSVSAQVQIVLSKRGAPMYPGEISRLLQDATVAPDSFEASDELGSPDGTTPADQLAIRRAAAEAYAALSPAERSLLGLLLAGRPYKEIPSEIPELNNPTAITRALQRICEGFMQRLLAQLGARHDETTRLRPKAATELLLGVLVTVPQVRAELLAADEEVEP